MSHQQVFWRERFERFHAENPQVYGMLRRLAHEVRSRGIQHMGMRLLFERVRWDMMMMTASCDGFKLNNNFAPFYSRLLMNRCPSLRGMFETRKMAGDQLELLSKGKAA